MLKRLKEATGWITERTEEKPETGLILGSGLSEAFSDLENEKIISQSDVPHFPTPSVEGHAGNLIFGEISGENVLIQQGRTHWYEGKSMDDLAFPVRVMYLLGVRNLFITNAAGGVNEDFQPGDLVAISDHINNVGQNPLRGENMEELGPRFPDLSRAYDPELKKEAREAAKQLDLELKEGVYVMTSGPSYETPAEIEAFNRLGGDLVGMSTVPEVIAANHCGLDVAAISCITNKAAGLQDKLSHEEVIEVTEKVRGDLASLLEKILQLA